MQLRIVIEVEITLIVCIQTDQLVRKLAFVGFNVLLRDFCGTDNAIEHRIQKTNIYFLAGKYA